MKFRQMTSSLVVDNVGQSASFWKNALGFEMVMCFPDENAPVWAMLRKDDVAFQLQDRKAVAEQHPFMAERNPGGSCSFYINVDNVRDVYERLEKAGGKILSQPEETFYHTIEFNFLDDDGFLFTFAEDLPGHEQ